MEQFEPFDSEYRTGSTQPPKSYRIIIALLMMAVIFLGGIVSALGMMNIRLFHALKQQNPDPAALAFADTQPAPVSRCASGKPCLGITGEAISDFCRSYYSLPQGLYVTQIAYDVGIYTGDVLLSVDGTSIHDPESLDVLLCGYSVGDRVEAVIYRNGTQHRIQIVLPEE